MAALDLRRCEPAWEARLTCSREGRLQADTHTGALDCYVPRVVLRRLTARRSPSRPTGLRSRLQRAARLRDSQIQVPGSVGKGEDLTAGGRLRARRPGGDGARARTVAG